MLRRVRRGAAGVLLATAALAIAGALAGLVVLAQAQPPQLPHTFFGLAVVEGPGGGVILAPKGLLVTAFHPL